MAKTPRMTEIFRIKEAEEEETQFIQMNKSAFEMTPEMYAAVEKTPELWDYIKDEAEWAGGVEGGLANSTIVTSPQENQEMGSAPVWTICDQDARLFEFEWDERSKQWKKTA